MTSLAPSPQPAPGAGTAVPGRYSASAGSGTIPASGESGALSGPWAIETQGMTLTYSRAPEAFMQSYSLTLSSYETTNEITGTHMAVKVEAYYRIRKDWNLYHTSGWTQNQKFEVQAFSADPSGVTYGTVSAGTFGPMGIAYTAQPWYFRRYWNSDDVEIDQACVGFNYYCTDAGADYTYETNTAANGLPQSAWLTNFSKHQHSYNAGTQMEGCNLNWNSFNGSLVVIPGEPYIAWKATLNTKIGGYRTDQDVIQDVPNSIDQVGTWLTGGVSLLRDYSIGNVGHIQGQIPNDNTVGVAGYDPSRHDWS